MSGTSRYWHEGKKNDYNQARELWTQVISEQIEKNTCENTPKLLGKDKVKEMKVNTIDCYFL